MFYKQTENGYILGIGTGSGGTQITEAEYDGILSAIHSRPTAPEGYEYRLKTDLTWELREMPADEEPEEEEATEEDLAEALKEMGVLADEEI